MGNIFNYDIPKSEQEAHIFAIQLLIPKEELIAFINKGGQTIKQKNIIKEFIFVIFAAAIT